RPTLTFSRTPPSTASPLRSSAPPFAPRLGEPLRLAQVQLARAQHRQAIHPDKVLAPRDEQVRQAASRQVLQDRRDPLYPRRVTDRQPLALALVGDTRHHERLLLHPRRLLQRLLHAAVRHHLAADLGETRHAIGDTEESVVVDLHHVSSYIPAVLDR